MEKENNAILKELTENFPALTHISRQNVYYVPEGYFPALTDNILNQIEEDQNIRSFSTTNPYSLTPTYFEELPVTILCIIKRHEETNVESNPELSEISAVLSGLKNNPYKLPAGYFDDLSYNHTPMVSTPGKSLSLFRRLTLVRYAAAALITGLLATGIIFLREEKSSTSLTDKYKFSAAPFNPQDVQSLTEDEISDFLMTHSNSQNSNTIPNILSDDKPLENNIKSISDQEIQEYLKNNPEPGEHSSNS